MKTQRKRLTSKKETYLVILSVSIILIGLGILYTYNLSGWLINDDEGSFLYQVWRMTEGEQPYQDFFTTRWPLFLYTGAGWMTIMGAEAIPMRAICVALTLGTSLLTFLLAYETLPAEAALLAMFLFLLHPQVFYFGRYFQPEAFYLFFSLLALYLFSLATKKRNLVLLAVASVAFAVGALYKLLTILVFVGCSLYLAVRWLREQDSRREVALQALVFLASYGIIFGLSIVLIVARFPAFGHSVIKPNITQIEATTISQNISKGVVFLASYFVSFAPFLLLALPATLRGWTGNRDTELLSWQLPTAIAFTVLSRELFHRLLLYLTPYLSILCAASLEPIRRLSSRSLLLLAIVGALIVPWGIVDTQALLRTESDTREIARWIRDSTSCETHIVSDYQELNFYSRRPSTPLGAEISYVVLDSGQVTKDDLINDIEENGGRVVILDISPDTAHQLVSIRNYKDFRAYLEENFTLVDTVSRAEQELEIHVRGIKEIEPMGQGAYIKSVQP